VFVQPLRDLLQVLFFDLPLLLTEQQPGRHLHNHHHMITVNNITCDCTEPGYCPHFGKKTDLGTHRRIWEILQGINIDDVSRAAYLTKWANAKMQSGDTTNNITYGPTEITPERKPCNCGSGKRRQIR
jgi:hypothetical protein